jgi:hypothetical protein
MSILRLTIIRLKETPKFLIGEGRDEEVVETLQAIATKYNRPCSLTLERLQACGVTGEATGRRKSVGAHASSRFSFAEVIVHLKGLFETRKIGLSTSLIWFSWLLIGLAYPLYNVFLPSYLKSRGAQFGEASDYITWRNYAIINMCGIWGPVLAGFMCASPWFWGRRGNHFRCNSIRALADFRHRNHDYWSFDNDGILLLLHASSFGKRKSRFQLCYQLLFSM